MKQPVDHIIRSQLPWRSGPGITECGYDASKVTAITREVYTARLKELGQQRTAMLTCMTCATTVRNWSTWEQDPRHAIGREVEWERRWSRNPTDRGDILRDELLAIADMIESHRDEFDAKLAEIKGRREWVAQKANRDVKRPTISVVKPL
jgi:hypothetical protein